MVKAVMEFLELACSRQRALRRAQRRLAMIMQPRAAAGGDDQALWYQCHLARSDRFAAQLGYHLALSFSATAVAIALGMPFGVLAYRRRVAARPIFAVVNTV